MEITQTGSVFGEKIAIRFGALFLEFAVINNQNGYAIVDLTNSECDNQSVLFSNWERGEIKNALSNLSLIYVNMDRGYLSDNELDGITNAIFLLKLNLINKMFLKAISTMNYLFLRKVVGKDELNRLLMDELNLFLGEVSSMGSHVPAEFYDIVKTEMDEGDYLSYANNDNFSDLVAAAIKDIMGEVDENVYNLYTYIAGELKEKELSKEEED